MKRFRFFFLIAVSLINTPIYCAPPEGNWELTFEDDFYTPTLNREKWNYLTGPRRDGNWNKEGVITDGDGFIHIVTLQRDAKIISGAIDTKGRFEQRYGYFEARCKLPQTQGHWSALWLLSREFGATDSELTSGAEVDIFEYHVLMGNMIHHAVHWPRYGPTLKSEKKYTPIFNDGRFHIFSLLWSKDKYTFFVDNKITWETTKGVSRVAQYILLSNEVSSWAGEIHTSKLPDGMTCSYIRAYKQRD